MKECPIPIADGGIGGATTALALACKGRAVHLIKQSSQFGEIGTGSLLGLNSYKMLEHLNLTDAIDEAAIWPDFNVIHSLKPD